MTGFIRLRGCFQVGLRILRATLWGKCTAPMYCIPHWRVRYMPSRQKTGTIIRMRHTGRSKWLNSGWQEGGGNLKSRIAHYRFGLRMNMHSLLISYYLWTSKLNSRPLWNDTHHGLLPERVAFIDGAWHISHGYWESPRIGKTLQDNGPMNGHSIIGWILRLSNSWEPHFCRRLSMNLCSIPTLTNTARQIRRSCRKPKVWKASCFVHLLLLKRPCYFILCQAMFGIWSGHSQSVLRIIWRLSTCLQKCATMSTQKCSANSNIHQIPLSL